MRAEEFIIPDRVEGPNQDTKTTVGDPPPSLSLTMGTSTAFSGIAGWTDNFSYRWYYEDEDETKIALGSPGSFSASNPGSENLSRGVVNDTPGTFRYYVEITNSYTYAPPGGGPPTTGSAVKTIDAANVVVMNPTLGAIAINWPAETEAGYLPEPITGNMSYVIDLWGPGGAFSSIGPTSERAITRALEPGDWDIKVIARYGNEIAALGGGQPVEIRAGETNPVPVMMSADEFLTPDRDGWLNQDTTLSTGDTPPLLSLTMKTATVFSGTPGWTDDFLYGWYYTDAGGTRTDLTAADNFSGPGPRTFSYTVDTSTEGTFGYSVEITNNYTYVSTDGTTTTGSAVKSVDAATVTVIPGYSVGDAGPGGGTVFYYDPAGFSSGGLICHFLEAGPLMSIGTVGWGADGTPVTTGSAIGDGYTNTNAIIYVLENLTNETGTAAQEARAYNGGGYTDWFLPSFDELRELYAAESSIPVINLYASVRSSTEDDAYHAWSVGNAGAPGYWSDPKPGPLEFYPVRAF
jgi:hypothetical protein